ncbi:hypothetical protein ACK3SF_05630 [Candidatus Nanosalina sp. VS9-1]|uniref:hypothetical protein n=1 Tax=Candidatus Nanosalina sp. VS9-1 TaxID=3388566 RepID=UPI0039E13DB0
MSGEKFDAIVEEDGDVFLQIDEENFLPLIQVFEHYEVRGLDSEDVAETLGVEASDVHRTMNYLHENGDVYRDLADRVQNFSVDERISNVAESVRNGEDFEEASRVYEDNLLDPEELEQNDRDIDAPDFVEKTLDELAEKDAITPEDIVYRPESYVAENIEEIHIEWEMKGSELGVYLGWSEDIGPDMGFVSYSVDDERGKVLQVDAEEFNNRAGEMYRNAVFGIQ